MPESLLALAKSGAKPDVTVRIRAVVIQVEIEQPGIRAVVPIAATDRETLYSALPY